MPKSLELSDANTPLKDREKGKGKGEGREWDWIWGFMVWIRQEGGGERRCMQ